MLSGVPQILILTFLEEYPCVVSFIQYFIQDIDSNFIESF